MSKKSSSIVLLTTSVVLAVAVFISAYIVRPNDETDVLAKARERQSKSLVSVNEPLETDQNVLSKEEKMKNAVYEMLLNDKNFTNAISSTISSDEKFVDTIFENVKPKIDNYLQAKVDNYVAEFTPQIASYVDALYKAEDPSIFVDQLIEPVTVKIYTDLSAKITSDIQKAFASDFASAFLGAKTEIENDIYQRVIDNLDLIAPDYVKAVKAEVLDEVDSKIPEYEEALKAYIDEQVSLVTEDVAISLYEKYRSAIASDVGDEAVAIAYEKYGEQILVDIINAVLLRLDNVAASASVYEMPTEVNEKPEIVEEVKPELEEKPVVEEKKVAPPIAPPTFVNSTTERNISNDEYIRERMERRSAIITDIIQKLK